MQSFCGSKRASHAREMKPKPVQTPLLPTTWLPVDLDHVTRSRILLLRILLGFWGFQFGTVHMAEVDIGILFVSSAAMFVSLNNS